MSSLQRRTRVVWASREYTRFKSLVEREAARDSGATFRNVFRRAMSQMRPARPMTARLLADVSVWSKAARRPIVALGRHLRRAVEQHCSVVFECRDRLLNTTGVARCQ